MFFPVLSTSGKEVGCLSWEVKEGKKESALCYSPATNLRGSYRTLATLIEIRVARSAYRLEDGTWHMKLFNFLGSEKNILL